MEISKTRLENWSVRGSWHAEQVDLFKAPETILLCLVGKVYNHPKSDKHHDGKEIITSPIQDVHGITIVTGSGTVYILGEIDPNYKQWLEDNGYSYNSENPIKIYK
jgi:hypothetical protein